ncbi:MAG TPA: glycosyltransferase [Puia sp.]|jgi:glycosyltransferase involved in cell wall biosynthesis|nr:glycosyltransferase [Puia sp.]
MKPIKILLLNYYWPPSGGPAVQRWLDITRYLSACGIQTDVVTVDEKLATYPFVDATLITRIDPSTRTFRTGTSELFGIYKRFIGKGKVPASGLVDEPHPTLLQKLARFARGNFFLPDPRKGWNNHAYDRAAALISSEKIDVVFTAGPPQSTHLIGLRLKKHFPHIRWVADIHDYWTEISYLSKFYRTAIAGWFDRRLEKKVLQSADRIMTHCESSKTLQCEKLAGRDCPKIFVHTMGYNELLFRPRPPEKQTFFEIIYTGIMADHYEPDMLFRALRTAIHQRPDIPVKLKFVGSLASTIRDSISELGLGPLLEELPYVPHSAVVEELHNSTALFLINPKFENEKIHVPGKIYEYLAVFKPILSISPHGSENEQIIARMHAGRNFSRSEETQLSQYLVELMDRWQQEKNIDLPENPDIRVYGRRHEAERLGHIIEDLSPR